MKNFLLSTPVLLTVLLAVVKLWVPAIPWLVVFSPILFVAVTVWIALSAAFGCFVGLGFIQGGFAWQK